MNNPVDESGEGAGFGVETPMVTEKMVNDVARRIYEDRHASMANVWSWDDSGLDNENPNARAEYERYARSAIAALSTDAEPVKPYGYVVELRTNRIQHQNAIARSRVQPYLQVANACVKHWRTIYTEDHWLFEIAPLYAAPPATSVAVKAIAPADVYKALKPWVNTDAIDRDYVSAISRSVASALSAQVQDVAGLSAWQGWDQSRMPWSEAKHKDAVCYAAFGEAWSMNDAAALIGFIERTWTAAPAAKQDVP